jgi:hypothetical protein
MDMDYKSKYFKYKKKYISLKNSVDDYDGGMFGKKYDITPNVKDSIKKSLNIDQSETPEQKLNINDMIEKGEKKVEADRQKFVSFEINKSGETKEFYKLDNKYNENNSDTDTKNIFNFSKELLRYRLTKKLIELSDKLNKKKLWKDINPVFYDTSTLLRKDKGKEKKVFSINDYISIIINSSNKYHNTLWFNCDNNQGFKCKTYLNDFFETEQKSTVFILNSFFTSLVTPEEEKDKFRINLSFKEKDKKKKSKIQLYYNMDNLTGKWDEDKNKIKIVLYYKNKSNLWEPYDNDYLLDKNGKKLILGLGPSASGKTHFAKEIISFLSKNSRENSNNPKCYLSIDGGNSREISYIYQLVINSFSSCCKFCSNGQCTGECNFCSSGIKNLFGSDGLFHCCKKEMKKYLEKNKDESNFSIYVPDTYSKCIYLGARILGCKEKPDEFYKGITDSNTNYLTLFIWQHKGGVVHHRFTHNLYTTGNNPHEYIHKIDQGKGLEEKVHSSKETCNDEYIKKFIRTTLKQKKIKIKINGSLIESGMKEKKDKIQSIINQIIEFFKNEKYILDVWEFDECPLSDNEYKCNTTIKSGMEREENEGKKYSSNKFDISFQTGLNALKKGSKHGGIIEIHNSGRIDGESIIIEHGSNILNINNTIGEIQENFNCKFIHYPNTDNIGSNYENHAKIFNNNLLKKRKKRK